MNPYQPPQCAEPVAVTGDAPVMQVRYGLQYSLLFLSSGLVAAGVAILMVILAKSTAAPQIAIASLLIIGGLVQVAMAVICRKRVYMEVFENRIEFLSPVFPRWRRARPLSSMGTLTLNLHRLVARREDINRFIAWREAGCQPSGDEVESIH